MLLLTPPNWSQNQGITLPIVQVDYHVEDTFLKVEFAVEEPLSCFRAEIRSDNERSFEDSCVEIFLENPVNSKEYFNFETTSRGFILAERGESRLNRTLIPAEILQKIERKKQVASIAGDLICWSIELSIPAEIFGLSSFEGVHLRGNFYKCGDKAKTPHYLTAFPIETEKPDFHRPEFFSALL